MYPYMFIYIFILHILFILYIYRYIVTHKCLNSTLYIMYRGRGRHSLNLAITNCHNARARPLNSFIESSSQQWTRYHVLVSYRYIIHMYLYICIAYVLLLFVKATPISGSHTRVEIQKDIGRGTMIMYNIVEECACDETKEWERRAERQTVKNREKHNTI